MQLRRFLGSTVMRWLEDPDLLVAVPGHLPGDVASQARAPVVLERLRAIGAAVPKSRPPVYRRRIGSRRRK